MEETEAEEEEEEAEDGEEGEEEEEEGHEVVEEGEKGEEEEEARETATARQVRIKWAMKRSYEEEKDSEGIWRAIVKVIDKQSHNHKEVIRATFNAMMQDMGFGRRASPGNEEGFCTVAFKCSMVSRDSVAGHGH